jgi:hypothetical protein
MSDASAELRQIADAVLYEGYVLWPYRKSALKNQRRWTFGGVYPERHSDAHPDDAAAIRADCLIEAESDAEVDVRVRFLHVVERGVARVVDGAVEPVEQLVLDGERFVSWDEATEREYGATVAVDGSSQEIAIDVPAGRREEALRDRSGRVVGALIRTWRELRGTIAIRTERLREGLQRVAVQVANRSAFAGGDREAALRRAFCSTHVVLHAPDGRFVSLTDPPPELRAEAERCRNDGVWPVLVGSEGDRHTVLASPIILPDHPEVAPESPGDLFDASEIDQLLVLSILSMTDEEKAEMRASDPRAKKILERTESLSREELMRLHGAIREFGMTRAR